MATLSTDPLFGADSTIWTTIKGMAATVSSQTNNSVAAAATTDFSDPGAVVLLQMRINQVTNAATAVSNLAKALQEPSKNAVSNLR
ncbi:MAG: hypothetical protein RIQ93_2084 [Verrucomicrobiota bacterium]|jgi:hypothetical protein